MLSPTDAAGQEPVVGSAQRVVVARARAPRNAAVQHCLKYLGSYSIRILSSRGALRRSYDTDVPLILSCPTDHVPDWQPRSIFLKKNQNTPRPSEHPPVREENVKTFRWDQRLQIQNLFMAFKQVPRCG